MFNEYISLIYVMGCVKIFGKPCMRIHLATVRPYFFPKEFISAGVEYDILSVNIIITHFLQEIICYAIFF